jgi:exosortase A
MTAVLPIHKASPLLKGAEGWRVHLSVLGVLAGAILILFGGDAAGMARVWMESETFNHCALILPIIGWLVWQRLPELRKLAPVAWWPGLLLCAAGAAAWLLGEAGSVALARHMGLVLMLQGAVIACLGKAVSRGIAFPIFYALFLIPAGEGLVPPLQTVTAEMSMFLLALVGLPAHIEGIFITTPSGYFEVAEACSGVQFLIAMLALGALVANVCFRSWHRRLAFMAAAIVIPIIANGVRAWATIYIAHLSGIEFAASFDHIVYGWFFFAIVIALLMGVGWRFFDRRAGDPWFYPEKLQPERPASSPLFPVAAAAFALAALPLAWSAAVAASAEKAPAELFLPAVSGWERVPVTGRPWKPHFAGADRISMRRYRNPQGQTVDLAIAVFASQSEGRELVGYGQGAVGPESDWAWTASAAPPPGGRADRIASFGTVREVLTFYRVGNVMTGSPLEAKLETIKARLLSGPQRAVAILVSAPQPADGVSVRPALDAFVRALGPLDRLADGAAGLPQP